MWSILHLILLFELFQGFALQRAFLVALLQQSVQLYEIAFCREISLVRGGRKPSGCLIVVGLDAFASCIAAAKFALSFSVSLFRGKTIPFCGFSITLSDAFTRIKAESKFKLRICKILLGCFAVPFCNSLKESVGVNVIAIKDPRGRGTELADVQRHGDVILELEGDILVLA